MSGNSQQPLILRHRPQTFDEVRGHVAVLGALRRRLGEAGPPHAYLLTGPSGTGKTTVARLIAQALDANVLEIDAATHSGVDHMRSLGDFSFVLDGAGGMGTRMIIVDECHRLSRNAWDAALKSIEEPPPHLYWALCTTEMDKVPETIRTRSYHIPLERLPDRGIEEFLFDIVLAEGWEDTVQPEVFRLVAEQAEGSPRQALSLLQVTYDAPDAEEAGRIIRLQGSPEPLKQVFQVLASGRGTWETVRPLLNQLSDEDFDERTIRGACGYVIAALNREGSDKRARHLWGVLSCLTYPAHGFDARAILYTAIGRALWEEQ